MSLLDTMKQQHNDYMDDTPVISEKYRIMQKDHFYNGKVGTVSHIEDGKATVLIGVSNGTIIDFKHLEKVEG